MTHTSHSRPRFAMMTMLILIGFLVVAGPVHATQLASVSDGQKWDFDSVMVDGQPVFKIVRTAGSIKTVMHQITPEEVPFEDVDCELECGTVALDGCFGRCLRGSLHLLLFDQARGSVYVTGKTETGSNVRWVVFRVDVGSGRIIRIGHSFGTGFQTVTVSPDGRFLSYLMGSNQSAADGVWVLAIMDLSTGVEIAPTERLVRSEPRPLDTLADVKSYQWQDGTIVFTAVTRPRRLNAEARIGGGRATQYVYSVANDQLVTARERQVIPKR